MVLFTASCRVVKGKWTRQYIKIPHLVILTEEVVLHGEFILLLVEVEHLLFDGGRLLYQPLEVALQLLALVPLFLVLGLQVVILRL